MSGSPDPLPGSCRKLRSSVWLAGADDVVVGAAGDDVPQAARPRPAMTAAVATAARRVKVRIKGLLLSGSGHRRVGGERREGVENLLGASARPGLQVLHGVE